MTDAKERGIRRVLQGVVISDKAAKTVTVRVENLFQHARYKKFIRRSKTYLAHDEQSQAHNGDTVQIAESRPFSAHKRWRVVKIVKRAE